MILEKETFEQFGYYPSELKQRSNKKIVVACNECGKVRISAKHDYRARCRSCANKGEKNFFGKHHSDETKKKMSDALKGESHPLFGKHPGEETKKKISDANKGKKHWNWKNGASFEPYCEKFNDEFKEDIRDKFGRLCFLCDKTEEENGRKLSVHHVNGNKNCGCDGDETCQFVPLCVSCHGKMLSKKIDWEKKIKDMMKNTLNGWYKPEYLPIS